VWIVLGFGLMVQNYNNFLIYANISNKNLRVRIFFCTFAAELNHKTELYEKNTTLSIIFLAMSRVRACAV
jgi:hypothetical protein